MATIPTLRAPPLARLDAGPLDRLLDLANSSSIFNGMPGPRITWDRIDICHPIQLSVVRATRAVCTWLLVKITGGCAMARCRNDVVTVSLRLFYSA
jgi:hypothetical protein